MGPRVPRALVTTLLLAGVFCAPLYTPAYAEDNASTTASSTEEQASTTSEGAPLVVETFSNESIPTPEPLPTGVLLDNSYADTDWNIKIYGGGHYVYFFSGYDSLGNPPLVGNHTWTTNGTTTYIRLKPAGTTTCNDLRYNSGTDGIAIYAPDYSTSYTTNPWYTRAVGDGYCEFMINNGGIPPGTPLGAMFFGLVTDGTLAGSSANSGFSMLGTYEDPIPGGFAFQLCGEDGCSGGFGSSTPPTPPGPKISNVLFLPGIEQSRLYRTKIGCDDDSTSCEQSIWNPVNGDTWPSELWLTPDGKSGNPSIFTKQRDTVSEINLGPIKGVRKFYTSFFGDLNSLVGHENWREVTYDWRLSLDELLTHGAQHGSRIYYSEGTSTPYIEQTLRELASKSPTGKVTIVAHSNGGLVAKALLKKLGDTESAALVDKLVLVAVPQSGSPQAIGGLLYGYGSALPFDKCANLYFTSFFCGMYVSRSEVRNMALYSPMTYHLLPSQAYFDSVQDPNHSVFSFEGNNTFGTEIGTYGRTIDTWSELSDFLAAREGGRTQPPANNIDMPAIGNANLLEYARATHESLDTWTPPESIMVYQIAGWGDRTVSGISWYEELQSSYPTPVYKKQYRPIFVEDGDNVVPAPSALQMPESAHVRNMWVNFQEEADLKRRLPLMELGHGEILEVEDLRNALVAIITDGSILYTTTLGSLKPTEYKNPDRKLVFLIHSPVSVKIQNSVGESISDSVTDSIQTPIPGGDIGYFGELRYLVVPANGEYTLTLYGQNSGTFSLDIYNELHGAPGPITTLAAIPVEEGAVATMRIDGSSESMDSLQVDLDGDKVIDLTVNPITGKSTAHETPIRHYSHPVSNMLGEIAAQKSKIEPIPVIPSLVYPKVANSKTQKTTIENEKIRTEVQNSFTENSTKLTATAYNGVEIEQLILFFKNLLTYILDFLSRVLSINQSEIHEQAIR